MSTKVSHRTVKVATIQVVLPDMSEDEASDAISEAMNRVFEDWAYLKVGGQFMYATDRTAAYVGDFIVEGSWK